MPWTVNKRDGQFCVYKKDDSGKAIGESLGCHASEKEAQDQVAALYANVNEFRGTFSDVLVVTELRGSYPNVPIAADVDYDGLIAEDTRAGTQPVFLTVPIGKAGVTSGNKRHYDEAFVQELERQTLANKPVGLMGHLSEAERATAFPAEAVHWVGAMRDGDTLWGKAYVVPGAIRDRIQRYKAQGKAIATSIDAFAEGVWDETVKAMRMTAKSLRLNQIDIAPADRAGIPDLAAVPLLTTEMEREQAAAIQEGQPTMADKLEVLQELRKAKVPTMRGWTPPANTADVTELEAIRELLEVDEDADLVKLIREMREQHIQERQNAVKSRIRELAADDEVGIKIVPVREVVINMVEALEPQTIEEAEAKYNTIITSGPITELLKNRVVQAMGPRQGTPLQQQNGKNKYFVIPTDGKEEVR